MTYQQSVTSGVGQLDRLLGGLYIGDNVVWLDDSGSLAWVFALNFMRTSQDQHRPFIYVSFDRSPRNLIEKLGPLARNPDLTVLDCFTCGKGNRSPVFMTFYEGETSNLPCRIIKVEHPREIDHFVELLYRTHSTLEGAVGFIFESITGMQEVWGGEDHIINFYSHSCPRLYELNTVAYWIMEKKAHSSRLRAQISHIAQVVVDLAVKRGTTSLTILKAEKRDIVSLHNPHTYWAKDLTVTFDDEKRGAGGIDLGLRLKTLRNKRNLSQTELARLVGVTPSTISQVESNLIYPSLPAVLKMAEVLSVDVSSFFQTKAELQKPVVFPQSDAMTVKMAQLPDGIVNSKILIPVDFDSKVEPYLIEIPPQTSLPSHFFFHKGEEFGYLLSGELQLKMEKTVHNLTAGDIVYLSSEMPTQWKNSTTEKAVLLWMKIK